MVKVITDEIRNLIKEQLDAKVSVTKISKLFNISRPTIYKIGQNVKSNTSGRANICKNKKFVIQVKSAVKKLNKSRKKVSASKINNELDSPTSLRTIQRCLKVNKEFKLQNVQRKIFLTEENKASRCSKIKGWFRSKIDFNNVIFSDEARFSLDGPDNFRSWQLNNEEMEQNRKRRQMQGGSVMILGIMGFGSYLKIIKIDGTLTAKKYMEILTDSVFPDLERLYGNSFIWQQDNARPHVAKIVKDLFNQKSINVLEWPPYSPDLSIIENIWKVMKDEVYDGAQFESKLQLWSKIEEVAENIRNRTPSLIDRLYDGLIDRYLNIIGNHGENK